MEEGCINDIKANNLECSKLLIKNDTTDLLSTRNDSKLGLGTDIIPDADITYSLGTASRRFKELHLSPGTLHLGDQTMKSSSDGIELDKIVAEEISLTKNNVKQKFVPHNSLGVNHTFTMPQSLPSATRFLKCDTSGNFTFDNIDNIGIGTFDTDYPNPISPLQIQIDPNKDATDSSNFDNYSIIMSKVGTNATNAETGLCFDIQGGSYPKVTRSPGAAITHERTNGWSKGKLHFKTKQTATEDGDCVTSMTINEDGNVGIGTTSPISKLSVNGKISIISESSTPSQPADGVGYLYTKAGGELFWRSYDVAETKLSTNDFIVSLPVPIHRWKLNSIDDGITPSNINSAWPYGGQAVSGSDSGSGNKNLINTGETSSSDKYVRVFSDPYHGTVAKFTQNNTNNETVNQYMYINTPYSSGNIFYDIVNGDDLCTIACWIYSAKYTTYTTQTNTFWGISDIGAGSREVTLRHTHHSISSNHDKLELNFRNENSGVKHIISEMFTGMWTHVTICFKTGNYPTTGQQDTGEFICYINGAIKTNGSSSNFTNILTQADKFLVGANQDSSSVQWGLNGYVHDLRIYDKWLDGCQINQIMNYGL